MADRRIYAGYYRRYDSKLIYVVTVAKDADTSEEMVVWMPATYSEKHTYYTTSKQSFCESVLVAACASRSSNGRPRCGCWTRWWRALKRRAFFVRRARQMTISITSTIPGAGLVPPPITSTRKSSARTIASAYPSMNFASERSDTSEYLKRILKSLRVTWLF